MRSASRAIVLAALAAASLLGHAAPVAAQDPPPPLPPGDAPPPPADPPPPPSADRPPAPSALPPPFSALPPPPGALPPPPPQAPPVAEPSAPEPRPAQDDARVLKGQTFLTPVLLDSAFVSTYAGLGAELGREVDSNVMIQGMNALGSTQPLNYDNTLAIVTGHVQLGVSFLKRFEIGVEVNYASLSPSDQTTAVVLGSQNSYDVRPGLRVLAYRSPATGTQLGVRAYGIFDSASRLNPGPILAQIADQASAIANDPSRTACLQIGNLTCALPGFDAFAAEKVTHTIFGAGASVSLAQAFGSYFALQATLGGEVAGATTSSLASGSVHSTPGTFYMGLAPSISFGSSVPLALMAEYRLDVAVESFGDPTGMGLGTTTTMIRHSFAGGLYYTGRSELQLGAAFKGITATTTSDAGDLPATSIISGLVTMRYFF